MKGGTHVRIDDGTTPWLAEMAREFPKEFSRSLTRIGYWLRGEVQDAMRSGGRDIGEMWPGRSLLARFQPFSRMRGDFWKSWRQQGKAQGRMRESNSLQEALTRNSPLLRRGGKGKDRIFGFGSGRLTGAVRYKVNRATGSIHVGFLNGSAASSAWSIMAGKRGKKNSFEFRGNQPVTDKMRRMFWAAGVPISKDTTVLKQDKRPLIQPVFDRNRNEIHKRIGLYVDAYVRKLNSKHASAYVLKRL